MRRLILPLLAIWLASPLVAWGPEGHWIIGRIAQEHLVPNAANRVRLLLGSGVTLADAGSWADEIREERPETASWHYINIPPEATEFDLARDCANDDCITAQLRRFVGIVRLGVRDPEQRREALRFLIHFMGDLHQPLHAGYGQDRGGNDLEVVFREQPRNLHSLWDSALIGALGEERETIASRLAQSASAEQKREWQKGDLPAWTWESHLIAVRMVYGALPSGNPRQLSEAYVGQATQVMQEQLTKAGIRLAHVINDMWGH